MRPPGSILAAAVLALAACGPTAPSPSAAPSVAQQTPGPEASGPPAAEVYAAIRTQIEAIRGLEPTADVDPVTIDEAQLRTNLTAEFDAEWTPAKLAIEEDLLHALGLIPAGASLRDLTLDLQAGQVAGYYSPDKDQLFVVSRSGRIGIAERVTYAHEFTHQLQDQHVDLEKLGGDRASETDAGLAVLGLIEGDATQAQTTWTIQNLAPEDLGELLGSALDPAALAALARAPRYLRDTTLFTYNAGLGFVSAITSAGGDAALEAAYADPPTSTEQVLHPDRYLDRDVPTEVPIPSDIAATAGSGWSETARDTLGELVLRIWLEDGKATAAVAAAAVEGWEGDRLVLLRGANGAIAIGLHTTWQTTADADEFAAAATSALGALQLQGQVGHEAGSTSVVIGIGAPSAQLVAALGG